MNWGRVLLDTYIEIFFTVAAIGNSLLFIPQIIRLLKEKHAREVSFITFFGFNVINVAYLLHGLVKNDHILLITSGLSTLANSIVTLQILYYRVQTFRNDNLRKA